MRTPLLRLGPHLRALALLLLLAGAAYEYAHLDHHLRHTGHDRGHEHDIDGELHRECLVFHGGFLVDAAEPPAHAWVLLGAAPQPARRLAAVAVDRLLPDCRAPPTS